MSHASGIDHGRRCLMLFFAAAGLFLSPPHGSRALAAARQPSPAPLATALDAARAGDPRPLQALGSIADPAGAAVAAARLAAFRLDGSAAEQAREAFLQSGSTDPTLAAALWSAIGDCRFAIGDYAGAADAADRWLAVAPADDPDRAGVEQTASIARSLAGEPGQRLDGPVRPGMLTAAHDKVGLTRAAVAINRQMQDAVIDSGANLSVVSASAAARLGLRMIEGVHGVQGATERNVATRLAIAPTLDFGGTRLTDVVFLVLDDDKLQFPVPGGYRIDAIIGFPVLRAVGRVRFDADGGFAVEAPAKAAAPPANLRAVGNMLYVDAEVNGLVLPLHLDTGASASDLTSRFAEAQPAIVRGLAARTERRAGAGGSSEGRARVWPTPVFTIAGRRLTLPAIPIHIDEARNGVADRYGTLGKDLLGRVRSYTIDLAGMRFELGAPID